MDEKKELEIPKEFMKEDWKSNKVVIQEPTGGDLMEVRDRSGGKEGVAVILTINACVVEAPWKVKDVDAVKNLKGGLFLWLITQIESVINLTAKKKEI